jgi:hypothetical protein
MFALQNRGELKGVIEREFDNLISRLRKFVRTEHNEDGTHTGVTYSGPVTNITVVNGIVTEVS